MPHFFRGFVEIGSLKNFFSEYFCLLVLYLDFLFVSIFRSYLVWELLFRDWY